MSDSGAGKGPRDPWRPIADELAERLATPDGARLTRLLQLAGLIDLGPEPPPEPPPASPRSPGAEPPAWQGARPIRIWRPRMRDGAEVFERPAPSPLGDHYAATRSFARRKAPGVRRIVWLGESAAAGYLYAPHRTPAGLLRERLGGVAGGWEVIDLARTNETLAGLAGTAVAAGQLAPDLFVLFAGNNWNLLETPWLSPYAPSIAWRQRLAVALLEEGLVGARRLAADRMGRKVRSTLARIAALARSADARVLVVVPPVSLGAWETRQPVAGLGARDTGRWHGWVEAALRALARENWEEALDLADRAVGLDDGSCATSHRLRARALEGAGRLGEAREAAQSEIDAASYATLGFLAAPQLTSVARRALEDTVAEHGWRALDLPAVFAERSGDALPGRELFLDYCHLSSEGMALAVEAVATEIESLSFEAPVETASDTASASSVPHPPDSPRPSSFSSPDSDTDPEVDPEAEAGIEATARLGAALHTAHRMLPVGEGRDAVVAWCREALARRPGIAASMLDYADAVTAPLAARWTAAQRRNQARPHPVLPQHGWGYEHLDGELLRVFAQVLAESRARIDGRPAAELLGELLDRRLAVPAGGLDLAADPFWLWEPLERFFPEVMESGERDGRATHRSPWPRTSFGFVPGRGTRGEGWSLELVARIPGRAAGEPGGETSDDGEEGSIPPDATEAPGEVVVELDGTILGRLACGPSWRRERLVFDLPSEGPLPRRLDLRWPLGPPSADGCLERAIRRLQEGVEADLYPVFGEVASLRLTPPAGSGAGAAPSKGSGR